MEKETKTTHKLSIIVPAYNEEESVGPLMQNLRLVQCQLMENTPLKEVEFVFVNDGSTDRTAEVMQQYKNEIRIVDYQKNQGYGAALQSGFAAASGDILSFLDCDGTCSPLSFVKMCNVLFEEQADLVIGNRMDRILSQMPFTRRLGNWLFAKQLTYLGGQKISDTASGIRVFSRQAYQLLQPLPLGLNFTPAMTARAVHERLKLKEVPIDYSERRGLSKLNVVTHGFQFFWTILETALLYNPLKLFSAIALIFFVLGMALIARPAYDYLTLQEPPFGYYLYRSISSMAAFMVSLQIFLFGALGGLTVNTFFHRHNERRRTQRWIKKFGFFHRLPLYGLVLMLLGLPIGGIYAYQGILGQGITLHWSWLLLATGAVIAGVQMLFAGAMMHVIVNIQRIRQAS